MTCEKCGNSNIMHYRQRRKDGIWVVIARCANGHNPIKSRPFYPVSQFDVMSLPVFEKSEEATQLYLPTEPTQNIDEFYSLDLIEQRRQIAARAEQLTPRRLRMK